MDVDTGAMAAEVGKERMGHLDATGICLDLSCSVRNRDAISDCPTESEEEHCGHK
jgi:hypothetical protein